VSCQNGPELTSQLQPEAQPMPGTLSANPSTSVSADSPMVLLDNNAPKQRMPTPTPRQMANLVQPLLVRMDHTRELIRYKKPPLSSAMELDMEVDDGDESVDQENDGMSWGSLEEEDSEDE
jgi:hypothetical protein